MGAPLPPDLERLGVVLTEATARAAAVRAHQIKVLRRLAACVAASALVFAATPTHLGPANAPGSGWLGLADAYGSVGHDPCDPPHGAAHGCAIDPPPPQAR
ncbi:MAG TPA: hypothetical protein VFZ00_08905 [Solirubrobacter sp.]|nr:hypothetical protein [Solirubrobacter sp.]